MRRPPPSTRSAAPARSRQVTPPVAQPVAAEPPAPELTPEQKGALFDEFERYLRQPAAPP